GRYNWSLRAGTGPVKPPADVTGFRAGAGRGKTGGHIKDGGPPRFRLLATLTQHSLPSLAPRPSGLGGLTRMPIRLDKLVSERFGLSRRAAQDAVRNGRIDLAGERCDEPGREVEADAPLEYFPSRPKARTVAGRLRVLHEDRHVLIVDKPAG